jgi:hypothetical protein
MMRNEWELRDLIACWTLDEDDWKVLANKTGATRLGFALLLKFFDLEGRFPAGPEELPAAAIDYVAGLVKVPAAELAAYAWSGRTIKYHRAQIRDERGFREVAGEDEQRMVEWLAGELCSVELSVDRLREDLLARFREDRIEPPGPSRIERILGAARSLFERRFTHGIIERLSAMAIERLEQLLTAEQDGVLAELKSDPGKPGLNTILEEVDKLERVRGLGLPVDLFADCSEKLIAAWRARAAAAYPSDLRVMPQPVRLTLLAVLCWARTAEIIDGLVDLLIEVVDKIRTHAENRVEGELVRELKRVRGKQSLLFALAEAAVEHPDETVRDALFPVVPEATLRQLVKEAEANERAFQQRVRKVIRGSYSNHYRRMLPKLLDALEFRSSTSTHRPVMDALELLERYVEVPGHKRLYRAVERVPLDGVVPGEWRQAVVDEHGKIERVPYELCVLRALRDAIRRREIHVDGARRWRNPDEDLPADFERNRAVHYAAIHKPLDPAVFIADLQQRLQAALCRLDDAIRSGSAGGVRIGTKHGKPWIFVPPLEKLPDAPNLPALHAEIERRHGMIDLLDVLKEADHLSGFTRKLISVASREITDADTARRRKLLVSFALGSNIGIKRIADAIDGHPDDTEAALRRQADLLHPREPPRRDRRGRQQDPQRQRRAAVGVRHGMHVGFKAVRLLGLEPDDRVARPLRRPGRDGLLARGEEAAVHLQPADHLLGLRGRRDAARAAQPRHRCRDREQRHRHARRLDRRVRVLRAARLPADGSLQADRGDAPLRPRARNRPAVVGDHDRDLRPQDQLAAARPVLRRAGEVRHRAQARHCRSPTALATVHARRPQAPRPPGARRARPRRPHHLPMQPPLKRSRPPRRARSPAGRRDLEQRRRVHPLRQEQRTGRR